MLRIPLQLQSCVSTSHGMSRFVTAMEDRDDLVDRLLTLAGTIMEDVAPTALTSRLCDSAAHRAAVIRDAGDAIYKLALAAEVALKA
ncbi:hypothetical protein P1X14_00095 [Sphingomonas sp. AOB5]|uniref:hypothetical protein n=1 Tax=Sphingomonas sp. AOB5 TaxID=3034017 RepID=UPI0023F788D8|nr:hypothetical protein [Sphingomonas sp. AOB5]MDF7773631.1 hypothetical protein [Sphingomonas sp. AOB5]